MRPVLVLTRGDVERLLDPDRLVEGLAEAMRELSEGRASMPPRIGARSPDGLLAVMPAHLPSAGVMEAKLVTVFPANPELGLDSHQAVIVAFDPTTGTPVALMDATHITAVRTAAGSALATRLLARPESSVVAVLGTGVQARAHAEAVPRVLGSVSEVRVAGRTPDRARALAEELEGVVRTPVDVVDSFEEAVRGADVVCVTTHAVQPVLRREWLAEGAHVNSVGLNTEGREVGADVVANARVVVEARASALAAPPAGANDLLWPIGEGLLSADDVVEIGEILSGERHGRTSPEEITLYKSVGVAVQDAVAAGQVLDAARVAGIGTQVDL